jgi:hypothetical protein
MSILDNEEKILNNSDWVIERTTVYNIINELRSQLLIRINDLENKNDELRAELDFIKRNITISKPVDFYQDEYCPNIRF